MDILFNRLVRKYTPAMNERVMNGLACTYIPLGEYYLDNIFRVAARSFPEGMEYVGYAPCTPQEEFYETTRRNNRRDFDLARSDIYLVKFHFRYQGKDLPPKFIYLPFVRDGGIIHLAGSCFHIIPVISDKVISPGPDSVFVRLLRTRLTFKRCLHHFMANNVRETHYVVWSQIFHKKTKEKQKVPVTTRAFTTAMHYLLAKYGFSEVFGRYAGFVPVVGEDEINERVYPPEQWVICRSLQVKPKTYIGDFYEPSKIRLAIPIEHWTSYTQMLVAGFYYIVDHFPSRMQAGYVNHRKLWMILLGHIILSGRYGEGKLYESIEEHFNSLDEYVDTIVIKKLTEIGHTINNFYDLLALLISMKFMTGSDNTDTIAKVYGKTLETEYYIYYSITRHIFRLVFGFYKLASKKVITQEDIIELLNKNLKPRAIFKITSSIAVKTVSYSGDNKYPRITALLAEQESIPNARRGRSKRLVLDASKHIHPSAAEAGSVLFLPKANPTPMARVNPYVTLDFNTCTIVPNPKFEQTLAEIDAKMKRSVIYPKKSKTS